MSATHCRDCGAVIHQMQEKAIGESRDRAWQVVWADAQETWVCPVTDNEHVPGEPRRPVQVVVKHGDTETMIWLSLAEAGNFVIGPIQEAVDDGEASWLLRVDDPERFATISHWADNIFKMTD